MTEPDLRIDFVAISLHGGHDDSDGPHVPSESQEE